MFELLLLVISYGAMLLLLMPPTGAGVISAAVMFALGVGLMICKKSHRICFWKSKQYYLIPSAALIVMCMAPFFYIRWLPSSKMQAIASIFHMTIEAMLIVGAILLAVLSIYFVYSALQMIASQSAFKRNVICSIIASVVTVILAQIMINVPILSMGCLNFMWGVLIVASVILLLYCLLGKGLLAVSIGTGIFMVISTINVYVYSFRRRLFEPVDVFSAGTAMNVAENYSLFPIPQKLLVGWAIFSIMIIALFLLQYRDKAGLTGKNEWFYWQAALLASLQSPFIHLT